MLSKLRYFSNEPDVSVTDLRSGINVSSVLAEIGISDAIVRKVDTGTLSAAFIAEKAGRRRFLKTHLDSHGQETLLKESVILAALYPEELSPQYVEMCSGTDKRNWLVMNALNPPLFDYTFDEVSSFAVELTSSLRGFKKVSLIPKEDSILTLLVEAWAALDNLSSHKLISSEIHRSVRSHLVLVDNEIGNYAPCICHGDLGPNNLMSDGSRVFAIDWEDAFWGVEGYDFLFWLTFFCNRKYYSTDIFGKTSLGKPLECALVVMILLLKSELSFRDGSYHANSLNFNQRIQEIIAFQ
ncbi:MAG: aminoglycoside phosphotransferase family protein [Proteobacteria bacterium]|nr:aminoglycoside phosphotransferase family protein [Pseudomonadota bacterium]MBU1584358.1 aminoglycoside phosphotransferase family protein [Pseudomonadota bacterium]